MPKGEKFYFIVANFTLGAGTERAVTNLANELVDHENEVTIISCHSKGGPSYFDLRDSVEVVHLGIEKEVGWLSRSRQILTGIITAVDQTGAFIIGTHTGVNILLPMIAFLRRGWSIACEHASFNSYFLTRLNRIVRPFAYRFLDKVVVLTETEQKKYQELGIPAVVIPNQLPFHAKLPRLNRRKRLLSVGRLTAMKGFNSLINIAAPILEKHTDWDLVIIGEGEQRDELSALIKSLGREDQIKLLPPTKDIKRFYEDSSIYVMTSRTEALPMVILEAQACGLPTIAYDCPTGPRELISDNYDGFIVPLDDQKKFTERVELMIENPQLHYVFSVNSFYSSNRFSSDKIYSLWESTLDSINR